MARFTVPLANEMGINQSSICFVSAQQRSPEDYKLINTNLPGSVLPTITVPMDFESEAPKHSTPTHLANGMYINKNSICLHCGAVGFP